MSQADRLRIRDQAAKAALCLAKKLGAQISLTTKTGGTVTVWAVVLPGGQMVDPHSGHTNLFEISFDVPRQTNFPPATRFTPQDLVTYDGVKYAVTRVEFGNENISMTPDIILHCVREGVDQYIDG